MLKSDYCPLIMGLEIPLSGIASSRFIGTRNDKEEVAASLGILHHFCKLPLYTSPLGDILNTSTILLNFINSNLCLPTLIL